MGSSFLGWTKPVNSVTRESPWAKETLSKPKSRSISDCRAGLTIRHLSIQFLGIIRDSFAPSLRHATYNEQLLQVIIESYSQRCSLGMLIVCEELPAQCIHAILQTIHEQPDHLQFLKTQTECCTDDGAITGTIP